MFKKFCLFSSLCIYFYIHDRKAEKFKLHLKHEDISTRKLKMQTFLYGVYVCLLFSIIFDVMPNIWCWEVSLWFWDESVVNHSKTAVRIRLPNHGFSRIHKIINPGEAAYLGWVSSRSMGPNHGRIYDLHVDMIRVMTRLKRPSVAAGCTACLGIDEWSYRVVNWY